jgi:hypothetical protein
MPKLKLPPKSKAQLIQDVKDDLARHYKDPLEAIDYLLHCFNGWDLEGIIGELRSRR